MILRWIQTQAVMILAGFAALLAVLLAVQTVRLEGLKLWPFEIEGASPRADRLQASLDDVDAAQEQSRLAARAQRLEAENRYRQLAEEADEQVEQARIGAMDAAERYIAGNRLRAPANCSVPRDTGTSAPSGSAESGNGPGEIAELDGTRVAVDAEDIRICTDNTIRLQAVQEWAAELGE